MVTQPRRVVFVVFDGAKMLDISGPAEVFAEANLFGADYRLRYVSSSGSSVVTSTGTRLAMDMLLDDVATADTIVVAGGEVLVSDPIAHDLIASVKRAEQRTRRLVSICTGAFVLAAAGLLSGRRATTHWRHAPLLARSYPDIEVLPDALFVEDGAIYTSAGVTAGIDLALALVERDHGADLARHVARSLVMFMQRPANQSQFSASLIGNAPRRSPVKAAIEFVTAQPSHPHSTTSLAAAVGVSPRHLTRLFAAELGISPARFLQNLRVDHAKSLLVAGSDVSSTAASSGFGSTESMRRTFIAVIGVSPSEYRARFLTAVGPEGTSAEKVPT